MLPKREPDQLPSGVHEGEVINTSSCCPNEDVDQGKAGTHDVPPGILPLANASSLAKLHEQSDDAIFAKTAHEV